MKCLLEEGNLNKIYFFGVYQFVNDGPFYYAAIGVRDDGLAFYNDTKPDKEDGDNLTYLIKKKVPFNIISTVYYSKIVKTKDLGFTHQINFITKATDSSFCIYISKNEEEYVGPVLKLLKAAKIKVRKEKVNLSPIY